MSNSPTRYLLSVTRGIASYAALVGGLGCLAWLAQSIEAVPLLHWGSWDGVDGPVPPLVVLDAGHGGHDGGAVANDTIEKIVALEIAKRVRFHLEHQGVRVKMTRDSDVFVPLEQRSAEANETHAAAFISLHLNTSVDAPEVSGIETYFSNRKTPFQPHPPGAQPPPVTAETRDTLGEKLARSIQRCACSTSHAENRGIKERSYAVVLHTFCPAALIECGFLTQKAEAAKLNTQDYRDHLAEGIASGIAEFLKTQPLKPPPDIALASLPSAHPNPSAPPIPEP